MKAVLPKPVHESYKRHRKQRTTQIILPVALAMLLFIAWIVLVIVGTAGGGDVGRWAAISTMWIAIPVCIMGFTFLLLLGGLVYLMGRLLDITPTYTGRVQDFVHKLAIRIRRAADAAAKPVITVSSVGASINRFLGRK